jgi:hypothetical protein
LPKSSAAIAGKWSAAVAGTIQPARWLLENGQQRLLERSNQRDATGGNKSSPDRAINCNLVPVEPKLSNGSLKHTGVFNASSCKNTFPKLEGEKTSVGARSHFHELSKQKSSVLT